MSRTARVHASGRQTLGYQITQDTDTPSLKTINNTSTKRCVLKILPLAVCFLVRLVLGRSNEA